EWWDAREGIRRQEIAIAALTIELQRQILMESVRASIEVRDFTTAQSQMDELESLGEMTALSGTPVLVGRIHEGLNQNADALTSYRAAVDSSDRAVSAQGRMREVA